MQARNWERYVFSRTTMSETVIPAFEEIGRPYTDREADNLRTCGKFVYAAECNSCNTKHFAGFNKCRSRWCINCNHVRSLAWIARLLPLLEEHIERGGYVTKINYTIKDMDLLHPAIKGLEKAWRGLIHDDKHLRKRFKQRFPGGIRSLEVKLGKNSGLWHPHYHTINIQDTYEKDYEWLAEAWWKITENIFGEKGSVWLKGYDKKNGLLKAVIESLKYIMHPEKTIYTDSVNLLEAYLSLKGKRQVNTWGTLRKLLSAADIEKELMKDDAEKNLTDFICQNCGCTEAELKALMYSKISEEDILFDYNKKGLKGQ